MKAASPDRMVKLGMGLLPEDRKAHGLAMILSLSENVVLASLQRLFPRRWLDVGKEREVVAQYIADLRIATPSPRRLVQFLSGGTQQKVVLAKWLVSKPKVLILDEPTRGIDVGAKAEVHSLMSSLAQAGIGIMMISSDLPEIMAMSDRIVVMHEGRITAILDRRDATQELIMAYASGQKG